MKLYGIPISVHTRKVQLALRTKGLDHQLEVVVPIAPDTLPDNWKSLSPTGLIPVLEDDGFVLADSGAILQYLDARYPGPRIFPDNPQERGRSVWIEAYMGEFFRRVLHPLFHERVVAPMQGRQPDGGRVSNALDVVAPGYFRHLEDIARHRWLVGANLSVADISVGANLVLLHYLGEAESLNGYPALQGYFKGLLSAPAFVLQLAAERPFADQMGLSQASLAA